MLLHLDNCGFTRENKGTLGLHVV